MNKEITKDWQAALVESFRSEAGLWQEERHSWGVIWRHALRVIRVNRINVRSLLIFRNTLINCDAGEVTGTAKSDLIRIMDKLSAERAQKRRKLNSDCLIYSLTKPLDK